MLPLAERHHHHNNTPLSVRFCATLEAPLTEPALETRDFFRDPDLAQDPYQYYEVLRANSTVYREPHHDVSMVTGYEEALAVYHDPEAFSACNAVSGPFPPFPVPLEGDDVSERIEKHRDELPMSDQLPTFDPPKHTHHRGLLLRLLTPKRLKENEEFMWHLADQTIDEFHANGHCELVTDVRPTLHHARHRGPARRARSRPRRRPGEAGRQAR